MARWICISNQINDKITRQKNIWGVSRRYIKAISKVKIGDTLLMYTVQEIVNKEIHPSLITSEYEAISEVYEDTKHLFETPKNMANEDFPLRIKIKLITRFDKPIQFKQLVPKLSFIKNKKVWTGSIRRAMREIPEKDYQLIVYNKNDK